MTPRERILARGRAYDLLADLFAHGPRRREHLALAGLDVPADPDEAAAEHHRVLGREVPPFASIWFHPEGLIGGEVQDAMRALMVEAGFPLEAEPDHLAEELRLLAWLAGAEADALADDHGSIDRVRHLTARALAQLGWLPVLAASISRAGAPLYDEALSLLQALVDAHAAALETTPDLFPLPTFDRPRLHIPASSGLVWTHTALTRIARAHAVPAGMRSRKEMIDTLLEEGTRFGVLPAITTALVAEIDAVHHLLAPKAPPFLERLATTRAYVQGMLSSR